MIFIYHNQISDDDFFFIQELIFAANYLQAPINVPVTSDKFWFLTKNRAFSLPCPFNNEGNYVIRYSLIMFWIES